MSVTVNNKNECYVYYEILKQLGPKSILDIGTYQAQIGTISRQLLNAAIDPFIIFDGVASDRLPLLPIYKKIYNNIFALNDIASRGYDTVVLLNADKLFDEKERQFIYDWLPGHTLSFLTDNNGSYNMSELGFNCQEIEFEGKNYYLYLKR